MGYWAVVDTEATNCPKVEGQLDVKNGQVYDCGVWIIDDDGNPQEHLNMVNEDVFFSMPQAMKEAYYAEKIPQYMRDIWDKKREVVDTWGMWRKFVDLCAKYNVQGIVAHNAWFDVAVLNSTMRYQTKSRKRYFLPYCVPVVDSLKLAQETICKTPEYVEFCKQNGYMTNHLKPRPRATAEVLWRFLTKNNDFMEEHTGLDDAKIEAQIFTLCRKMKEEKGV